MEIGNRLFSQSAAMGALLKELLAELNAARALGPDAKVARNAATEALTTLRDATESLLQQYADKPERALSVSVPYLQMCGLVLGGALLFRVRSGAEGRAIWPPAPASGRAWLHSHPRQSLCGRRLVE